MTTKNRHNKMHIFQKESDFIKNTKNCLTKTISWFTSFYLKSELFVYDFYANKLVLSNLDVNGNLLIGPEGCIYGDINAMEVCIQGTVIGDIAAEGDIIIESTAQVKGNVSTPSLKILEGAEILGQVDFNFSTYSSLNHFK